MARTLRQKWDTVNDCASTARPNLAAEAERHRIALSREVPEYRAKFVTLPHGQFEISVTPSNFSSVINARMGFNPLLDCPRKCRTAAEQEERDKENRQRATKLARQRVRHLVKSALADHMLTFVYRENVIDRARVAADWKRFNRLFSVRYPDWKYLAVIEKQERGAYHIHVAVQGRQDIRWLLRCWLLAIGQPPGDVSSWLVGGVKLGARSLGAVNVEGPNRRWGGAGKQWNRGKLAGYLTKYIGKEFEDSDKYTKKYWHSKNIEKPVIERFWLRAETYEEAIVEAHDLIYFTGANNISMWNDSAAGVVWITGETDRERLGQVVQCVPDFDLLND